MTTRSKKTTAAAAAPAAKSKRPVRSPAAPVSKEIARPASAKTKAKPAAKPKAQEKAKRAAALAAEPAVVAQIRELEAQLDRLIDEASRHDVSSLDPEDAETWHGEPSFDAEATIPFLPAPETAAAPPESGESIVENVAGPGAAFGGEAPPAAQSSGASMGGGAVPAAPESVFDTARELLSSDFYLRKWGRLAMRGRSEEVDDFGFDPIYDAKLKPVLDFLYTKYFRVETTGIASVPKTGRCLLVANHSGTLPLDGVMIKAAVKREGRDVRWLTEDFIYHMPYLGSAMNRLGAVRACQENAERLLAKEQLVAVFPEGVKGIGKLFAERYRLQRFGRGGFIKLCLRTGTPIVPVAVTGAEETNPLLFKIEHLSKALGVPYVPVTPTFPLLGPLGLLPAPTKWTIQFGEPLDLSSHGPSAADDEILVGKLAERVRATIQGMLDRTIGSRKSVFFG
jgi:1-acyl-sn-glycerol-3-phosphate acyltransferase